MKFRPSGGLLLVFFLFSVLISSAQEPHQRLIEMTRQKAYAIASSLGLDDDAADRFSSIYVKEAVAVEDLMVNADPDVAIIKQINELEKQRDQQVRSMLESEEYDLYKYILEEEATRQASRFDSIQIYLDNPEFKQKTLEYYDENVTPYLVYYHQTYFRPALKQKHYWLINKSRKTLYDYEAVRQAEKTGDATAAQLEEARNNLDHGITHLKKVRKRYRDELDYITVALGSLERAWSDDYINLVQEHFADDVYQRIKEYRYSMNAYGVDYILGELSLILFDLWNPRTYIESRDSLAEIFRAKIQ